MDLDTDKLREGLENYRATLEHQQKRMRDEHIEVQRAFHRLFIAYGGRMSEDMQQRWAGTSQWFEEYLDETVRLDRFLEDRIEQLRHL